MTKQDCIIIGGGLAGIAAAVRLAEAGTRVTLVETRQRLGGRATSFTDPTTGDTLDNCQHVLMRCCTYLLDLYERLGVADSIEWHRMFHFVDAAGHDDRMRADPLPAPCHLTRSLLGFGQFTLGEKLAIARAVWAMMRTDRRTVADVSFAQWLARYRQPQRVVRRFWAVVIISACNEQLDRVSARYALRVFQEGFLCNRTGHEMGLPGVPLVRVYDPAERAITASGGKLMLSMSADGFEFDGTRVTALRLGDGTTLPAAHFISTVPFDRLDKLVTDAMRAADARLRRLRELEVSPIIGIHLFFDRPRNVIPVPHAALTDSPLHWVFDKGDHLHGVISGAHALVDKPADEIAQLAVAEIHRHFPSSRGAKLARHRVVKEKRATFAITPGSDALRPTTTGAIGNLLLAGDWTDTGWPATMEGAVRSGYRAAAAVAGTSMDVAELPAGPLYRLLAKRALPDRD